MEILMMQKALQKVRNNREHFVVLSVIIYLNMKLTHEVLAMY